MDTITYALLNKKIKDKLSFSFWGFKKVNELPIQGEINYIYLLPSGENNYAEYIWIDNRWELLGDINKSNLDYNDLLNKPKINGVEIVGNQELLTYTASTQEPLNKKILWIDVDDNTKAEKENDYNLLTNKPSINGIELKGNKTIKELGLDYSWYKLV